MGTAYFVSYKYVSVYQLFHRYVYIISSEQKTRRNSGLLGIWNALRILQMNQKILDTVSNFSLP